MKKNQQRYQKDQYISGSFVLALSCIVILGWIFNIQILVQIFPTFVPMQFNTALGFMMAAFCMLFWPKRRIISHVLSICLMLLGILTLVEYIFLIDLHIDQVLMEHYVLTLTSHPGRMSPNTALCFIAIGFSYFVSAFKNVTCRIMSITNIMAVGILGLLSILAYITGMRFVFSWGNLTGMAFHTALCFFVIGLGSFRPYARPLFRKKFSHSLLLPSLLCASGFVIFLISWQNLVSAEDKGIKAGIQEDAIDAGKEIELNLQHRVQAIKRLFNRMIWLNSIDNQLLQNDIDNYFSDYPNLLIISEQNSSSEKHKLYLQEDLDLNTAKLDLNKCYSELLKYDNKHQFVVKPIADLICIYSPGHDLLAVLNEKLFVNHVFSSKSFVNYGVLITHENSAQSIMNKVTANDFYQRQWSGEYKFRLYGEQWQIKLWVDQYQVRDLSSFYPVTYLFISLLFTVLLSFSVRIWQGTRKTNFNLKQINQKFNTVIENSPSSILIIDTDNNIIFANQQASNLTSFSIDELIGSNLSKLIPKEHQLQHPTYTASYNKNPLSKKMGDLNNISILTKSGQTTPVEIVLTPIEVESKLCILTTILDVSERKASEKKITTYTEALQRSNEELDSFAYIASHDLKEPLRGINNYASFLIEDYEDILDDEGKSQLKTLQKLSKRMEDLINNLLHFSRVGRTELSYQDCDLHEIVQHKLEMLEDFIKRNNAVINIPKQLPHMHCDKVRIGEVFQNLITNGIKYNDKPRKVITIKFNEKPEEIVFSIQDSGIGIKKENFKNIFKIFKRLHGREEFGGGTGAGMTIFKKIIERHKGKIWLSSVEGKGTTFYFSLPKIIRKDDAT